MGDDSWDDCAASWDEDDIVREYSEKAFASLLSELQDSLLAASRILDFGCGTGLLTERILKRFPSIQVVALDSSPKMIEVLEHKRIPNAFPVCIDLSPDTKSSRTELCGKFDVIIASSVCAFLSSYEETTRLLHDMLIPGGYFIQWDWELTEKNPVYGLSENAVLQTLEAAGFIDVSVSRPFSMYSEEMGTSNVLMGIGKA